MSAWASLPTQLLQLQWLLSSPSEPVFKPNCYNYSAGSPVRLSHSSNPTVTTTMLVVLSVWASLQTQLLQLQWLLSCPSEPVFKPNCYNYSDCCPLRLSQSSNPTVTTTVLVLLSVWATLQTQLLQLQCSLSCPSEPVIVVLSVWASLQTQLLQLQCWFSCPSEPLFKPNRYNYNACCPVRLSQSSNPTVTTTVIIVLSIWTSLQTQLLQLQWLLSSPSEPVFKPNCYNYSAGSPVRLSHSSNPTVTTTMLIVLSIWASFSKPTVTINVLVILSVWASLPTHLLQLQWLLSVRLSQFSKPTVITTECVVLSVWANLQT